MSFLDKLRKGVDGIETEVKKLKELTEEGELITAEQLKDNLIKAKRFDSEVRQTYSEVSQLLNTIKSSGDLLNESKNKILSIKQKLCDIEENSGLQKFGYKLFEEQYSIETMDDIVFTETTAEEEEKQEVVVEPTGNYPNDEHSKTLNAKSLAEEFAQKANVSEERTTQTVQFAPDMPIVNNSRGSNERTKFVTKKPDNRNQIVAKKYDKLLTRTPQPHDFGITRRFTFLPQNYNNNKMDAKNTPEEPPFETTQTIRFNYINTGFQLGSALNPLTPPNASNNNGDSFVTVEFTPGLTTKRPKGISRVQNNNSKDDNKNMNKTFNNYHKEKDSKKWSDMTSTQRLPQSILQSVENDKITPEQPIPATDRTKSAHILRSIVGKGSGTPPLPKSRIDANFHNQILKHL